MKSAPIIIEGKEGPSTETEVENANSEVAAAKEEVDAAETKVAAAKNEVSAAKNEVAAAETKVVDAKEEVAAAETKVARAEERVARAQTEVALTKKELEDAIDSMEEAKERHLATPDPRGVRSAQRVLETAENNHESAKTTLKSAVSALNAAQEGVKAAQRLLDVYIEQLKQLSSLGSSHRPGKPSLAYFNSSIHLGDLLIFVELDISSLLREVKKIGRVQEYIAKEVIIQHHIRMDPWSDSKRTRVEQCEFKESLATYYDRRHSSETKLLKCMILNKFFPYHEVRASHIWKYSTKGAGLGEFGLNESDLSSPRNGMLMCISIEEAFDVKRLCFLVNRLHPDQIVVKVLDPSLIPLPIRKDHPRTFKDIDTKQLQHPEGKMPYRRILDWHAKCAYRSAIARGWIEASETFENFFDLSIDSSIPDLCIYQDELTT
jgi:hypothetical protein